MKSRKYVSSCSGERTSFPFSGFTADKTKEPCKARAKVVVKKKVMAIIWAGL